MYFAFLILKNILIFTPLKNLIMNTSISLHTKTQPLNLKKTFQFYKISVRRELYTC